MTDIKITTVAGVLSRITMLRKANEVDFWYFDFKKDGTEIVMEKAANETQRDVVESWFVSGAFPENIWNWKAGPDKAPLSREFRAKITTRTMSDLIV